MLTPRYRATQALLVALLLLLGGTGAFWFDRVYPHPADDRSKAALPGNSPDFSVPMAGANPPPTLPSTKTGKGLSTAQSLRIRFYELADPAANRGQPPYSDFCAGLNAGNVDLYLELLASITESGLVTERARLQSAILLRWATFDRPAALQMAVGLPGRDRNLCLNQLVRVWAQNDREAAWNYVRATSSAYPEDENLNLYGPLLAEHSQEDSAWALSRLRELPPGRSADLAAQSLFGAQASIDIDLARSWLDSLPSDSMRDRALFALTMHAAPSDPPQALESLQALGLPGAEIERSASRITRIWASESPAMATKWLALQGEHPLFPVVARTLAEQLTTRDPTAARTWLEPHALDPRYLPALLAHVETVSASNLNETQRWAETLPPGTNRSAVLSHLSHGSP